MEDRMSRKNKIIEMEIENLEFPNKGTGSYEEKCVKVKGGIPGQKVRVKLTRNRKDHKEGKIMEVLESSPLEKENGCAHTGICGGCVYQKLSYEDELKLKLEGVKSLFEKQNLNVDILGIEPSPILVGYRNKMEYTFGDEVKDGPLALGLHVKGNFYSIVNTDDCNIINQDFTIVREQVRSYFEKLGVPFYHKRSHEGLLRHLVIRRAQTTGEILVNLVTSSQIEFNKEEFKDKLIGISNLEGKISGIIHTVNDGLGDVVQADSAELLYGTDIIQEEILGLEFQISPFSFFQTNTIGAEKLYSIAREFAGEKADRVIFDLYSGTGTIAQMMAGVSKKVIGIEIVEEAVEMARKNAELNKLENVEFIAADVFDGVEALSDKPDLIIIDPPRDGIHPKAIDKIIDFNPESFVYISCNPVTLVRDLKIFKDRGYNIEKTKLMDMFPRTTHVETVVLMSKVEK
jgi:23S rRNA (uracil1939-C5)-methyltransferase